MDVFVSWSGERSRAVAQVIAPWVRQLIQCVNTWTSRDMEKGAGWLQEVSGKLSSTSFGIVCLTPENLPAPWLLFEAGALSKLGESRVWTFLLGVSPADVEYPLAQFQHTEFSKPELLELVQAIRAAAERNEEAVPSESDLATLFDALWGDFEASVTAIRDQQIDADAPERPEREILEEILDTVRGLGRRPHDSLVARRGSLNTTVDPNSAAGRAISKRLRELASEEGWVSQGSLMSDTTTGQPSPILDIFSDIFPDIAGPQGEDPEGGPVTDG